MPCCSEAMARSAMDSRCRHLFGPRSHRGSIGQTIERRTTEVDAVLKANNRVFLTLHQSGEPLECVLRREKLD